MENWAKRRTRHVRVHGPVHGPKTAGTVKELHVRHEKLGKTTYYARTRTWTRARTKNGRYRDTGIFLPYARLRRSCTCDIENGAKRRTRHVRVHGPVHGPKTDGTVKELHVRHGKLGKTTYYARTRTWTRARIKNGRYRDT